MAYTIEIGRRQFHGLRTNLHMHTIHSDGTRTHQELARIAGEAGLDVIVVTDHNTYVPGAEGWYAQTLLLVGEEIHDPGREPQGSHLLCFGIDRELAEHAADTQRVLDLVAVQGGFTFLAHPFERETAPFLPEPNLSWLDWQVSGYAGLELWNVMSEFKAAIKNKAHAVLLAYMPALALSGPYPETLRCWDRLLQNGPVSVLGGSDAHGTVYHLGPLTRAVLSYETLFRSVNTHLLAEQPLIGDLAHDKEIVYGALQAGHGFIGYEQPGPAAGFRFWAHSGGDEATMGETLVPRGRITLRAACPHPARLRLVRDGQVVAQARGRDLAFVTYEPGVYRLEAYRWHAGRERGWIFSNPIYVRAGARRE